MGASSSKHSTSMQGGSGVQLATLTPLPIEMTDAAISSMGLDNFLVVYGGVTLEIAKMFSKMYTPSTSQQDPVIDIDIYVSLMYPHTRTNVIKTLRASYVRNVDYIEEHVNERPAGHVGKVKLRVLLTPDCFKRLCMRSRTKASESVRTYFLRMETLTRRYFAAKALKSQRNVEVLLQNQRPIRATNSKIAPESGHIYIFPVEGRIPDLYRIGSTKDVKRRMREHGSSHADDIDPIMKISVPNVSMVEQCSNFWLKYKKYRKRKEVYHGDLEMIKSIVVSCGLAAVAQSDNGLFVESSRLKSPNNDPDNLSMVRFTIEATPL